MISEEKKDRHIIGVHLIEHRLQIEDFLSYGMDPVAKYLSFIGKSKIYDNGGSEVWR